MREIIAAVRTRGDAAVAEYTARFDGCVIDDARVPPSEVSAALEHASPELRAALDYAAGEIRAYHEAQVVPEVLVERDGVRLREVVVPVGRAGCYVPGGRADYPSTVLMTVIPARVAGVEQVVLCVPPRQDGTVAPATLAAAALAGVDEVYGVGGAQAIAAMAYGTESIRSVDLIVGPGNVYVAAAKREVSGVVGVEAFAGPSELVVIADESVRAELVAADLLAQAEHGPDGAAVLVTWRDDVAAAVDEAIERLLRDAAGRHLESTLAAVGRAVLVDGPEQAIAASNAIAPEHLELMTADPGSLVPRIRNAGAVFCGPWASAAIGDYVAGVNHVLPTARTARFASALRVDDYLRHVHVVDLDQAALHRLAPYVLTLAEVEGLTQHGRSIALRAEGGGS